MLKANPLISIVTLSWNHPEVTCQFLESTRKLTYRHFEILVCDMGSDIDPTEQINAGGYANTRVLRNEKNLGFAGGNNWGMLHAKGDYIFIVNNDTEVTPTLLDQLLEPFLNDPSVGVTCPKIRYFSNPSVIQYAGFNPINVYTGRTTAVGSLEKDQGQYDREGPTNGAHGCAMLVSREVINKVGKFPEKFFLYYEEWDWSARILKAGYKIWYVGKALIYHKESISVGKKSSKKVYYQTRNRILYMRRNTNLPQFSVFILFFVFFTAPKAIVSYAFSKEFKHLKSFVRGALWNLTTSRFSAV